MFQKKGADWSINYLKTRKKAESTKIRLFLELFSNERNLLLKIKKRKVSIWSWYFLFTFERVFSDFPLSRLWQHKTPTFDAYVKKVKKQTRIRLHKWCASHRINNSHSIIVCSPLFFSPICHFLHFYIPGVILSMINMFFSHRMQYIIAVCFFGWYAVMMKRIGFLSSPSHTSENV